MKFKIVIEAIKGTRQISELASEYSVHPNQISNWKREFLEKGASIFGTKSDTEKIALKKHKKLYSKKSDNSTMKLTG